MRKKLACICLEMTITQVAVRSEKSMFNIIVNDSAVYRTSRARYFFLYLAELIFCVICIVRSFARLLAGSINESYVLRILTVEVDMLHAESKETLQGYSD